MNRFFHEKFHICKIDQRLKHFCLDIFKIFKKYVKRNEFFRRIHYIYCAGKLSFWLKVKQQLIARKFFQINNRAALGSKVRRRVLNLSHTIKENRLEALNEAIRLNYTAYDMLYLILARKMGATLLTLDHGLKMIAKKEGIDTVI